MRGSDGNRYSAEWHILVLPGEEAEYEVAWATRNAPAPLTFKRGKEYTFTLIPQDLKGQTALFLESIKDGELVLFKNRGQLPASPKSWRDK